MNLLEELQYAFTRHIQMLFPDVSAVEYTLITDPHRQQFGDITTNIALILSKVHSQKPQSIAHLLCNQFQNPAIERIEIAGQGFINIFLTLQAWQTIFQSMIEKGDSFFALTEKEPRFHYSIEFVSANPTGPLHIGHGRGGIIGDVLGNILRYRGHTVIKEFYINDAGTQINKLGLSLKIRCEQLLGKSEELPSDAYHGDYVKELAQELVKEKGHSVLTESEIFFQNYAKEHMLHKIKETLLSYGIIFDVWFSEQSLHINHSIDHVLQVLMQKGYMYEREGALWLSSTTFGDDKDRVVRKSSGELTYVAADIAYLENKIKRGANHLIMVLGQDHHSYVIRLKAALSALGYNPAILDVILYQLVTLKEGDTILRMSKRAGHMTTLEDIITLVGIDVARFFYLNRKADAHLEFDVNLALKHTEENPVYYIQYAYVRTVSILEKAKAFQPLKDPLSEDSTFLANEEKLLIKKIASLTTILATISNSYQTHLLTYYILELAHLFHSYYGMHRIIDIEQIEKSRARLLLIKQLQHTFALCLKLMGISIPDKM
jgi:arginyl-tRNA synthetase